MPIEASNVRSSIHPVFLMTRYPPPAYADASDARVFQDAHGRARDAKKDLREAASVMRARKMARHAREYERVRSASRQARAQRGGARYYFLAPSADAEHAFAALLIFAERRYHVRPRSLFFLSVAPAEAIRQCCCRRC